jgi:hypothetical protein
MVRSQARPKNSARSIYKKGRRFHEKLARLYSKNILFHLIKRATPHPQFDGALLEIRGRKLKSDFNERTKKKDFDRNGDEIWSTKITPTNKCRPK